MSHHGSMRVAVRHFVAQLQTLGTWQGLLMMDHNRVTTSTDLARIWVHETRRIFADRLISHEDKEWFENLARLEGQMRLGLDWDGIVGLPGTAQNLIICADFMVPGADPKVSNQNCWRVPFHTFRKLLAEVLEVAVREWSRQKLQSKISTTVDHANMRENRACSSFSASHRPRAFALQVYEEVKHFESLQATVEEYLGEYNSETKQPMHLVMFDDAIEHVSRISRVIR